MLPNQFRLLFRDRRVIDADLDNPVRRPDLHATTLAPHSCVTGWVSFLVDNSGKPAYVVLTGSSLVGWRVT
ncbi:MAG TPA: hypothetical protein VFT62_10360 [Mycobacteriales bacterium]|nr:hypothetical protein [Mycobacteriales bacterium]